MEAFDLLNADILSVSFVHFNVAAIFFGAIPTYGVTTVRHDNTDLAVTIETTMNWRI